MTSAQSPAAGLAAAIRAGAGGLYSLEAACELVIGTGYGCWRQWGLRGYRVGRYLRFRERHVEEWLQTREV